MYFGNLTRFDAYKAIINTIRDVRTVMGRNLIGDREIPFWEYAKYKHNERNLELANSLTKMKCIKERLKKAIR